MSSSLYRDHNQNSAPALANGLTDAPTKTLSVYGPNFTHLAQYDTTAGSNAWPPSYTGFTPKDDTPQPGLAGEKNTGYHER